MKALFFILPIFTIVFLPAAERTLAREKKRLEAVREESGQTCMAFAGISTLAAAYGACAFALGNPVLGTCNCCASAGACYLAYQHGKEYLDARMRLRYKYGKSVKFETD